MRASDRTRTAGSAIPASVTHRGGGPRVLLGSVSAGPVGLLLAAAGGQGGALGTRRCCRHRPRRPASTVGPRAEVFKPDRRVPESRYQARQRIPLGLQSPAHTANEHSYRSIIAHHAHPPRHASSAQINVGQRSTRDEHDRTGTNRRGTRRPALEAQVGRDGDRRGIRRGPDANPSTPA